MKSIYINDTRRDDRGTVENIVRRLEENCLLAQRSRADRMNAFRKNIPLACILFSPYRNDSAGVTKAKSFPSRINKRERINVCRKKPRSLQVFYRKLERRELRKVEIGGNRGIMESYWLHEIIAIVFANEESAHLRDQIFNDPRR